MAKLEKTWPYNAKVLLNYNTLLMRKKNLDHSLIEKNF